MKKILVSFIVACLCLSVLSPVAFAERYTNCADAMNEMGVFHGVKDDWGNVSYELGRGATRVEALVMLIRLLGEEDAAVGCTLSHNFVDVPADHWAYSYIAYAVDKGYTAGVSADSFDPNSTVRLKAYVTFLLRALGYSDANGDFSYDAALDKAVEIGMLPAGTYASGNSFCLRDDCVYLSILAMNTQMPHGGTTLAENLIAKGVIPADSVQKAKDAAWLADQELVKANISPNRILPEDSLTYSEYEGDKVINRMEHIVYYNDSANYFYHYEYDANGNLCSYEDDCLLEYENDRLVCVVCVKETMREDSEYSEEDYSIKISYEDNAEIPTAVITLGKLTRLETLDELGVEIPNVEKIIVKDDKGKVEATLYYNADGKLINQTDEKDRSIYEAEYDSEGSLQKEIARTYKWTSDSSILDASSGVDSQATYYYGYNEDGSLYNVTIWFMGKDKPEEFIFRYFGNGKLDRILWRETWDGEVWEQVNTVFDDQGHMKYPYN